MRLFLAVTALMLLALCVAPARAGQARDIVPTGAGGSERRVALVIGNNAYQHVTPLKNSVADAVAFKRELEARGFAVVYRENAGRRAMNDAVEEFLGKLSTDAVSVIFYSGHGVQINSANFMVPTDLQAEKEADVANDGIDLGRVLDRVAQTQAKFTLAVIDACRNNPFQGSGRAIGGSKGLAAPSGNASGVMVVYSAGANQQALDRLGGNDTNPNGLFTREFLKAMRIPGLKVQDAVNSVKMAVIEQAKAVGHVQTPAIYDQSVGTFVFTPGDGPMQGPGAMASQAPAPAASGPNAVEFSVDDIAKQEEAGRAKWDQWQGQMRAAFDKASAFEGRAETKRAVWDRFLVAYSQKNPYADDDDQLRAEAASRKAAVQDGPVQVAPPVAPEADRRAGETFRDCPNCPEMVVMPAGGFAMGASTAERSATSSEGAPQRWLDYQSPQHAVSVRGFAIGKNAVTFAEWDSCVAEGGCGGYSPADRGWGRGSRPVIFVSWTNAQAYVQWLNGKAGGRVQASTGAGGPYRLPSEAEWEYAARAGTATGRYWGETIGSGYANCNGCGSQWDNRQIAPVGSFRPNPWGLYDMLGNVYQWTEDCWNANYAGAPTGGSAWTVGDCTNRVLRGGSWDDNPFYVRAASRGWLGSGQRLNSIGFRVAKTLP